MFWQKKILTGGSCKILCFPCKLFWFLSCYFLNFRFFLTENFLTGGSCKILCLPGKLWKVAPVSTTRWRLRCFWFRKKIHWILCKLLLSLLLSLSQRLRRNLFFSTEKRCSWNHSTQRFPTQSHTALKHISPYIWKLEKHLRVATL